MRAGDLDRRVTILRPIVTGTNDFNEPIVEPVAVRTVWASLIFKSADEEFAAGQRYAVRIVTFRMRFMADLAETDSLQCEGVTYDVKGIKELGRRDGLEIAAEAQP
jgi:SPP1 family predicted phage head-tail adaptor